ncbi:unnamed protein product [Echinostoma caproni]|uniref:Protein-tyrosine sulfotransferase n=1 Tax=Echinostoma caproni TaxID=27848 RepID=A0A183AW73_9TREM|nr:unnamed protein product [Echinostoma caproni]
MHAGHNETYPCTGLMRIKLDAHPMIRCGAEPMITLSVLELWKRVRNTLLGRAIEAGIYPDALNNATRAYIVETIRHMGPDAPVLCHKQPTTFQHLSTLGQLFPTAKFIHMVRDGRGAVASSINRHLLPNNYFQRSLDGWQGMVLQIIKDCEQLGPNHCIHVRYESLILQTEQEMRRVLNFIGVPWDPIVLHHETIKDQLTNLNTYEPSTVQFLKSVHNNSLAAWSLPSSPIPVDVLNKSCETVKLLKLLNYCPTKGYIPNYADVPSDNPDMSKILELARK